MNNKPILVRKAIPDKYLGNITKSEFFNNTSVNTIIEQAAIKYINSINEMKEETELFIKSPIDFPTSDANISRTYHFITKNRDLTREEVIKLLKI